MTTTFTLPFSRLNQIQFVEGIEDVTIEVLEPQDVIDAVVDNTLGAVDIGQAIENQVRADLLPSLDDVTSEIDRAIDSIVTAVTGALTDVRSELETFIDSSLGILEEDVENLRAALTADIERIVGTVSAEFDSLASLVENRVLPAVANVESSLTNTVNDVLEDVTTAIEQSTDEIDETLDGVSGALAELGDTLGDVRDDVQTVVTDVQTLVDNVPSDFEAAVEGAVKAAEPTVDDAGLFTQPVAFVSGVLREAVERQIGPETQAALDELRNREQ